MEGQSKKASMIEVITNVIVGYAWAVLMQILIFPLFGIFIPISTNFMLGLAFTVLSVIRTYIIRRIFNRIQVSKRLKVERF